MRAKKVPPMQPLPGVTGEAQEVYLEIMRTAQALGADLDALLKASHLSSPQYNVLRILRGAGTEGLPCQEIIDRMVVRDPDITRLLGRLKDRGLVVREVSPEDRRVVLSYLTEEGLRLVESLDDPVAQIHLDQLGHLGEERLRALGEDLRSIRKKLSHD